MQNTIILLLLSCHLGSIALTSVASVKYVGPIVYSADKPPILHFPAPTGVPREVHGKPKRVKYVPLPSNELPVLIYQGDQPPIHVLHSRPGEKQHDASFHKKDGDIPMLQVHSRKPQGLYVPIPNVHRSSGSATAPIYGPPSPFVYTGHPPIHIYGTPDSSYGKPAYEYQKGPFNYFKEKGKEIQSGIENLIRDIHDKGKEFLDNPFNVRGKKQGYSQGSGKLTYQPRPVYGPPPNGFPSPPQQYPSPSPAKPPALIPVYGPPRYPQQAPSKVPYATYHYSNTQGAYGYPQYAPGHPATGTQKYKVNPFEAISNFFSSLKQSKTAGKGYRPSAPFPPQPIPVYGPPAAPDKGIKESIHNFFNSISSGKKQVIGGFSGGFQKQKSPAPIPVYGPPRHVPGPLAPHPGVPPPFSPFPPPHFSHAAYRVPPGVTVPSPNYAPPNYLPPVGKPHPHSPAFPFRPSYEPPRYPGIPPNQFKSQAISGGAAPASQPNGQVSPSSSTSGSQQSSSNIAPQSLGSYRPLPAGGAKPVPGAIPSPLPPKSSEPAQIPSTDKSRTAAGTYPVPSRSGLPPVPGFPHYMLAPPGVQKPPILIYKGYKSPMYVYESHRSPPEAGRVGVRGRNATTGRGLEAYGSLGTFPSGYLGRSSNAVASVPSGGKSGNREPAQVTPTFSPPLITGSARKDTWTPVTGRGAEKAAADGNRASDRGERVSAELSVS